MFETILLLIVGLIILMILWRFAKSVTNLIINSIMGLILLFLVNVLQLFSLIGKPNIPIDVISVIVCALAGIPGAILMIILHLLGLY
jgi:pro-sigmaK processing inhibitor BofA